MWRSRSLLYQTSKFMEGFGPDMCGRADLPRPGSEAKGLREQGGVKRKGWGCQNRWLADTKKVSKGSIKTNTLQGTNISPKNGILKMIFLFPRWDMLISWRVCRHLCHVITFQLLYSSFQKLDRMNEQTQGSNRGYWVKRNRFTRLQSDLVPRLSSWNDSEMILN